MDRGRGDNHDRSGVNRTLTPGTTSPGRSRNAPIGRILGRRWPEVVQLVCFAWVVWLPVSMGKILYPALAVICGTSLLIIVRDRVDLTRRARGIVLAYLMFLVVWIGLGYVAGNLGATHQLLVWFGSAAIWVPWSLTLRGRHALRTGWVIAVVGSISSVTIIYLALCGLYRWDIPRFLEVTQLARSTLSGSGELAIGYAGIPVLIPIFSYLVVAACWPRDSLLPPRWLLVVSSVLVCVAGIACARRGVALTVLLVVAAAAVATLVRLVRRRSDLAGFVRSGGLVAPLLVITTAATAVTAFGRPLRRLAGSTIDLLRVLVSRGTVTGTAPGVPSSATRSVVGDTTPAPTVSAAPGVPGSTPPSGPGSSVADSVVPNVPSGVPTAPSLNVDDTVRYDQIGPVLRQWERSPWFGQGFGAVRDGAPPGVSRPWGMELQPLQVLMNVGIIGCVLLGVVLVLCAREVRRAHLRRPEHRGLLLAFGAASLALLAANAMNPVLQAVGHVWGVTAVLGVAQWLQTDGSASPDVGRTETTSPSEERSEDRSSAHGDVQDPPS